MELHQDSRLNLKISRLVFFSANANLQGSHRSGNGEGKNKILLRPGNFIPPILIPLKAGRNISGQCDLSDVFSFGSGGCRPLRISDILHHLVREIRFYQGILKTGAHKKVSNFTFIGEWSCDFFFWSW